MTWTILIIKKPHNGWYINYIENKLLDQIDKFKLQNFINVLIYEPNVKFYSDYVSVIDDEIEITDNFINVIYDKIKNGSDCVGLKGVIYVNENPLKFNNLSKTEDEICLPLTKLNPIKTGIIFNKINNIAYYTNSENLSNITDNVDSVDIPVMFLEKTVNIPISIIITAYQTQDYIEECLDSIERQTYFINNDNFEVLVGVDACQDTYNKLQNIRYKYRNISIYMMSENKGTYITTNTLIDLVKNENVIRFDSDDIMTPNLVKEVFNNKKDNDIIMLGYVDIKDGQVTSKLCVAGGIIYFKKSVMDNIAGGYQPWTCAADSEMMVRIMNKVKIMQLKKILFYRRIHDNSLTKRIDTGHNSEIRNYYTKQIKSKYKDDEIKIERITNKILENRNNIVYMITTYNRVYFLKKTIETWKNTFNKKYNWTLIVADDGSNDGTLDYLYNLNIDGVKIIIIENNRRGVHYQTNSLIKCALELNFNYGFKSDDDIIFKNKGWDDLYFNTSISTNFYHLIFYDKKWGEKRKELQESIFKYSTLENCTNYKNIQGAFWTFNRTVLESVGFFDIDNFNLCGLGHVDFSLRCCRLGFNDINNPYDIKDSNDYISLNMENYVSNNEYTIWNTDEIISNKLKLLDKYRTYINYNELPVNLYNDNIDIKRISFCIPAYKSQEYIEDCLDSIEKQLCEKEILVGVDHCVNTLNKVKQIGLKYKNLRVFWFPKNVGTSIVKNTLSKYAKYEIVSFFDSDDIMNNDYSKYVIENINDNNIIRFRYEDFDANKTIKRNYCANGVMSIYKDNFLKLNGFWEYRITEDYDFIERWKKIGNDNQLNIIGFKRRLHDNNISFDENNGCYSNYGKNLLTFSNNRVNNNEIINKSLLISKCEEIYVTINDYFDNIYCLNLDRRPDKWEKVKNRFDKLKLNVNRFSAVDGNNISDKVLNKYNKINKFEVGCILSHYNIIKDAKLNKYKRILIFEDDVIFCEDFNILFKNKISKIKNWKILYLGASQYQWSDIEFIDEYYYSNHTDGTFAFAIDESMYDEILETENIKDKPIDYKLWDIQKKYYKQCYTSFPNLVMSDVSDSDIRKSRDVDEHKSKMKWNLYEYK